MGGGSVSETAGGTVRGRGATGPGGYPHDTGYLEGLHKHAHYGTHLPAPRSL